MSSPTRQQPKNRALKFFVGSLFLVLLGGSILLFLIASGKLGDKNPLNATQTACLKDKVMEIKGYGNPVSATIENNTVRMLLRKDDKNYSIVTFDGCSGEVSGLLKVKTE